MRNSKIAARIREGKPIRLAMLGHFLPAYIAFAASAGYDGIWLDLEHRAMEAREVQALLAFCHLYDIDCLVRPATRERAALYRYLEDGAAGLIMPHVNDLETARALVQAVKFPPVGDRGVEGNGLETNFGLDLKPGRLNLVHHALQETLLALQVETLQALSILEDMVSLPGVDMVYIGPGDLGVRLAQMQSNLTFDDVLAQVADVCRRYNRPWGSMPHTLDEVRNLVKRGAQLIVWGNDVRLVRNGLHQCGADLNQVFSEVLP